MSVALRPDPRAEYQHRLAVRQATVDRAALLDVRMSTARGATFLGGLVLLGALFSTWAFSAWWLLVPVGAFVLLVTGHGTILRRHESAARALAYYRTALERLDERWLTHGTTGERYGDPSHPYSGDLDLFGRRSLFQLLSRARTRLGEDTLAAWLRQSAAAATIRARQTAVEELRTQVDVREQLALLDAEVHDELDQNELVRWGTQPPQPIGYGWRIVAVVLTVCVLVGLMAWLLFHARLSAVVIPALVQVCFVFSFRRRIAQVARTIDRAGSGLDILAQVLRVLEQQQFNTPLLREIRARLDIGGQPPSRRIARLHRLIQSLSNSLANQFFAPIAFMLCLPVHLVHAIETWRAEVGSHIPDWLASVGEFEALSSLAGYAYEHPDEPFPEIAEGGPLFEGRALAHPLLPREQAVRNDLVIGGALRLMLISGSNMSGKSTLLRTVGTNAVLALAGAPVRAESLRISPLQLGTAMRINDSLQDGRSLFYSVVARLKAVVDLSRQPLPLLFLLDEILQGTNSHDRRVGAEGVVRRLVEDGAIGLVTTHDLALTEIVASLGERAVNAHFEDHLTDGRMTFDYRIRPGVVQKSNALELMRMMGLDV